MTVRRMIPWVKLVSPEVSGAHGSSMALEFLDVQKGKTMSHLWLRYPGEALSEQYMDYEGREL